MASSLISLGLGSPAGVTPLLLVGLTVYEPVLSTLAVTGSRQPSISVTGSRERSLAVTGSYVPTLALTGSVEE